MAAANIINPYGTNSPSEGRIDYNQGSFFTAARATFPTGAASCEVPLKMGTKLGLCLVTSGDTANTSGAMSYLNNGNGTITVFRTTTSNVLTEFSYLAIPNG